MAMDDRYLVVLVTVPGEELAEKISSRVVNDGAAACVNSFKVNSTYRWKGEVMSEGEIMLVIKTTAHAFEKLKSLVVELHTYDIPEIIALPVEKGNRSYLDWISGTVLKEDDGEDGQ